MKKSSVILLILAANFSLSVEMKADNIPSQHHVFVNQSGYNLNKPKRFTSPCVNTQADYTISRTGSDEIVYRGKIVNSIGDFTDFRPAKRGIEYTIKVSGGNLKFGKSDPFRIEPFWMERVCLGPALQFMIDCRSVTGTHPSAYGGCPWRDGTYYTYEVPSLVLMYLSNPDVFTRIPPEIDYHADKKKVLDPQFKLVRAKNDKDALGTVRRYYKQLDPPVGDKVPDIIQLIHWGIGWYLPDPETRNPSGDPAGEKIHSQTVEQFAFFLYGYPYYQHYFTHNFYRQALDFTLEQWGKAGLLDVITKVGTFKGRHCPGHSIMPNLMMYEVATRETLKNPQRFLRAAVNQAGWVVRELDPADPKVTKGQRMSEHKLITGLVMLLREYPQNAPQGLPEWLEKWADIMIARSDNMWDFRRYDDKDWSLPRYAPGSHGGAGWNEPGNIAAFPGLCYAVASVLKDQARISRLQEIAAAHFDDLFGRNPLGVHSANDGPKDYFGVERGWPKKFRSNTCARLELVRGTLNSSASSEHYPFNPNTDFRHPEGWSAFNAAFNVGLAYTCRADTKIYLRDAISGKTINNWAYNRPVQVILQAPIGNAGGSLKTVQVQVAGDNTPYQTLKLHANAGEPFQFTGRVTFSKSPSSNVEKQLYVSVDKPLTFSYGYGFLKKSVTLNYH